MIHISIETKLRSICKACSKHADCDSVSNIAGCITVMFSQGCPLNKWGKDGEVIKNISLKKTENTTTRTNGIWPPADYKRITKICNTCHENATCPNMVKGCCGGGMYFQPTVACKLNKWEMKDGSLVINDEDIVPLTPNGVTK